MLAVDRRMAGESVSAADFKMIQQEVEKENEKGEAKRLLRMQSIEAEKLNVMLKVNLIVFLLVTDLFAIGPTSSRATGAAKAIACTKDQTSRLE